MVHSSQKMLFYKFCNRLSSGRKKLQIFAGLFCLLNMIGLGDTHLESASCSQIKPYQLISYMISILCPDVTVS